MNFIKKFFDALVYSIFPKICFYCKKALDYFTLAPLCDGCLKQIRFIEGLVCIKCGLPLYSGGEHCYNCKKLDRKFYFDNIRAVVEYKEPIKTLIHEYKYNKKVHLKNFLGDILTQWFSKNFLDYKDVDIICCVPMNPIKKFFRGYNQAELLAKELADKFKLNFIPQLLKRPKLTKSQFKLSKEKRLVNVKDAFIVNERFLGIIRNKNILLIDDVCTTAETINQCAKVLRNCNVKKIFAVVLARDV